MYHTFYKPTEYFTSQRSNKNCYLKVVCLLAQPQKILGMHFIGPQAGEVIQGYAAAMKCGLTYKQLEDTVGIHPTVSEEFTRVTITKRSGADPVPQSCCSWNCILVGGVTESEFNITDQFQESCICVLRTEKHEVSLICLLSFFCNDLII